MRLARVAELARASRARTHFATAHPSTHPPADPAPASEPRAPITASSRVDAATVAALQQTVQRQWARGETAAAAASVVRLGALLAARGDVDALSSLVLTLLARGETPSPPLLHTLLRLLVTTTPPRPALALRLLALLDRAEQVAIVSTETLRALLLQLCAVRVSTASAEGDAESAAETARAGAGMREVIALLDERRAVLDAATLTHVLRALLDARASLEELTRWLLRLAAAHVTLTDAALAARLLHALDTLAPDSRVWARLVAELLRAHVLLAAQAPLARVLQALLPLNDTESLLSLVHQLTSTVAGVAALRALDSTLLERALVPAFAASESRSRVLALVEELLRLHVPVSRELLLTALYTLLASRPPDLIPQLQRMLHVAVAQFDALDPMIALLVDEAVSVRGAAWWPALVARHLDADVRACFVSSAQELAPMPHCDSSLPLLPDTATLRAHVDALLARPARPSVRELRHVLAWCVRVCESDAGAALEVAQRVRALLTDHYAPSRALLHALLCAFARCDSVDDVRAVLAQMRAHPDLTPLPETYAHVLAMHVRRGDADALHADSSALQDTPPGPQSVLALLSAHLAHEGGATPAWCALAEAQRAHAHTWRPGLRAYVELRVALWEARPADAATWLATLPRDSATPSQRDVQRALVLALVTRSEALWDAVHAYLTRAALAPDALTWHALLVTHMALRPRDSEALGAMLQLAQRAAKPLLAATVAAVLEHAATLGAWSAASSLLDLVLASAPAATSGTAVPVSSRVLEAALRVARVQRDHTRLAALLHMLSASLMPSAACPRPGVSAALRVELLATVGVPHLAAVHVRALPWAPLLRSLIVAGDFAAAERVLAAFAHACAVRDPDTALSLPERLHTLALATPSPSSLLLFLAAELAQHTAYAALHEESRVVAMYAHALLHCGPCSQTTRMWELLAQHGLCEVPAALAAAALHLALVARAPAEARAFLTRVHAHAAHNALLRTRLVYTTLLDALAEALDSSLATVAALSWVPAVLRRRAPNQVAVQNALLSAPPASAPASTAVSAEALRARVAALLEARDVAALEALVAVPAQVAALPAATLPVLLRFFSELGDNERVLSLWQTMLTSRRDVELDDACFGAAFRAARDQGAAAVSALVAQLAGREDVTTQRAVLHSLLTYYCRRFDVARAEEVWREFEARGIPVSRVAWTALLSMYAQTGALDRAYAVLEQMQQQRVVPEDATWHALLSRVTELAPRDVPRLVQRMLLVPGLTEWAYEPVLRRYARERLGVPFDALCAQLRDAGVPTGPILLSQALVLALAKKSPARLKAVVDETLRAGLALRPFVLAELDAALRRASEERKHSWLRVVQHERERLLSANAVRSDVVDRYAHLQELVTASATRDAVRMRAHLDRMAAEHVQLDARMYDAVVDLAVALGDTAWQEQLLEEMRARGIQLTPRFYSRLLRAHAAARDHHAVERTWTQLRSLGMAPDDSAFAAYVALLANVRDVTRLDALHTELTRDGTLRARPNVARALSNALVLAATRLGDASLTERVLAQRSAENIAHDAESLTALLGFHARRNDASAVQATLREFSTRGLAYLARTHALLVAWHADQDDVSAARAAFREMLEAGHTPDEGTFRALLGMYARLEHWHQAAQLLDEMRARGMSLDKLPLELRLLVTQHARVPL